MTATADELLPATRNALSLLLLAMADDEFVIGFSDSEWTGIAPMLEEDVAMSSLAQDELGHAKALYELLAEVVGDGRDGDAIAYDRPPEGYYHARLLDHPRGDWADTIVRRFLYDTADAVRLEAVAASSFEPLRELVAKIRREERYHLMHVTAWFDRLASAPGEPRRRLEDALDRIGPEAASVLAPLPDDLSLVMAGILAATGPELERRWLDAITPVFARAELALPPPWSGRGTSRAGHSPAFRALWEGFTSVRRSIPGAEW